jgi:hypothetical protein
MSRPLRLVNIFLGVLCSLFMAWLIRDLFVSRPLPLPPVPSTSGQASTHAAPPPAERTSAASYGVITARNLFSPSRSENAAATVATGPKPVLHGVVMDGAKSRAYLEDPVAKRVIGYAVGDSVAGGRLQAIRADRVVIARPEGSVEVMLQDPAKPNPADANAAEAASGAAPRRAPRGAAATPAPAAEPAPVAQPAAPLPISRGGAFR